MTHNVYSRHFIHNLLLVPLYPRPARPHNPSGDYNTIGHPLTLLSPPLPGCRSVALRERSPTGRPMQLPLTERARSCNEIIKILASQSIHSLSNNHYLFLHFKRTNHNTQTRYAIVNTVPCFLTCILPNVSINYGRLSHNIST